MVRAAACRRRANRFARQTVNATPVARENSGRLGKIAAAGVANRRRFDSELNHPGPPMFGWIGHRVRDQAHFRENQRQRVTGFSHGPGG